MMPAFNKGQAVAWPPAPGCVAQVDEVRRKHVRLVYRARTGRLFRPIVNREKLAALQRASHETPPLPIFNILDRGIRPTLAPRSPAAEQS